MISYSPSLQSLLSNAFGFRNDNWTEHRVFELSEVLYHEIGGMNNTDIVSFLKKLTSPDSEDSPFAYQCKERHAEWREEYIADGMTEEEVVEMIQEEILHAFSENAPYYVEEVQKNIEDKMGTNKLYAIWLTTHEGVLKHYSDGFVLDINKYKIPNDAFVISDLEDQGALFVTTTSPEELLDTI